MNILYVAKLTDSKLKEKLIPLLLSPQIDHIYVLRDRSGIDFDDKITYLSPKKPLKGGFRHLLKVLKGIYYCRKYNIDAIMGVLITPHGYIGRVISFFTCLPYIHITIAGHREFWVDGRVEEQLNYWLLRKAMFIMVTGNQTKQYLLNKRVDPDKIVVLPNIPDNRFLGIKEVRFPKEREYDILFMSRIDKNKNLGLLLNALCALKKVRHPRVLIVGDGEELQNMIALTQSLGISDRVTFSGYVKAIEEKIDIYQNSKIFISCSKGEGFPVSLLEAMSCGCVPVVSNVGDIVDVIESGVNGYVFNDTDYESELVDYLTLLINDENRIKEMSERAQHIKHEISVENNAKIWNGVFTLLSHKK